MQRVQRAEQCSRRQKSKSSLTSHATCTLLQVTPAQESLDLFPAPYNNLPTLMFPYPKKVHPCLCLLRC